MGQRRQDGSILLVVLFAAVTMSAFMLVGGVVLASYRQAAETQFRALGQARNVARAGLVDAFSWFRRQTSQPVTRFAPRRDLQADPPLIETEDPKIGLVRSFKISGDIWARYEVRKQDADPRLMVRDISRRRGLSGVGQVWYLPAWGVVYRRVDPARPYNQAPNRILATAHAFTEIRRLTLTPPAPAAINAARGDAVVLGTNTRVRGNDGAGVAYPRDTGEPLVQGEVSGHPDLAPVEAFDPSPEAVFGVSLETLKSLADDVITAPNRFPSPVPRESLLLATTDLVFDDNRPLRGNAVVVVVGDVLVDASPRNFFTGLLYVTGNLTFRAPSLLRGSAIVLGRVVLQGSGDYAEIEFEERVLSALMVSMGQYRLSQAIRFAE